MSEMKTTRPDFPHHEVIHKILAVIEPYTNDVRDVAAIAAIITAYSLRFAQLSVGKTLDRQEFINWCLNAFQRSDDEHAAAILMGRVQN
jgi:hypothetical protein